MIKQHFLISAPGRTEISGNHTDHQRGCVLAAAVNLETVADVTLNDSNNICVRSEGYPETVVGLDDLTWCRRRLLPAGRPAQGIRCRGTLHCPARQRTELFRSL